VLKKSSLSTPLKRLVEIFQTTNYGRVEGLRVRDGEPVFTPAPRIVKDVKLGASDIGARPELESEDFALKREHIELVDQLRRFGSGTIECIEVKGGLPFRLMIEQHI
jgi:hypothetical protein